MGVDGKKEGKTIVESIIDKMESWSDVILKCSKFFIDWEMHSSIGQIEERIWSHPKVLQSLHKF